MWKIAYVHAIWQKEKRRNKKTWLYILIFTNRSTKCKLENNDVSYLQEVGRDGVEGVWEYTIYKMFDF